MKVTKRQLKRIIREEKSRLVNEQGVWARGESASALLSFGKAYAGLGAAVQEQTDASVEAYLELDVSGSFDAEADQHFLEAVYEQNPNAIETAYNTLRGPLQSLGGIDASDVIGALDEAMEIIRQGEAEVETDTRVAGDL